MRRFCPIHRLYFVRGECEVCGPGGYKPRPPALTVESPKAKPAKEPKP